MPYLQSLVKNEDKITLSPSPNNGVSVFSSPANGNLDMGGYNIVNAGTIAIGKPTDDQATIFFTNTTGTYPLEGDGDKLYYNGTLLADANDIQDIASWADYAASGNVDMNNNIIEYVNSVGFNVAGSSPDIGTMYVYDDTTYGVNPTIGIALNGGGIQPVLKDWSYYPAFYQVNMNNNIVSDIGFQNPPSAGEASLKLNAGTIKFALGDTLDSVGGVLTVSPNGGVGGFYNPIPVASGWSPYPATATVDLSNNELVGASKVGIKTLGGEGELTTSGAGAILLFNGSPISTGTGGDVAQWSTFPSVNNLILPNPTTPTIPLTIGTRASGASVEIETNQNFNVNADNAIVLNAAFDDLTGDSTFSMSDVAHTMLIDRGNSIAGQATINMTAQNGTGGRINIYAQSSSPLAPAAGGLVDITAYSSIGSPSPLALSRVNVEAATVSVQAGGLGALAFVPGSINLLSGLGTGIQILTTLGVINIASGVALTLAGGLGVFLNGASSGVQVAGGNLKITNGNRLATDEIGSFSSGGSIGFVSPIVAGKIADSASSYGTAGQVATATGSANNWTWSALPTPPAVKQATYYKSVNQILNSGNTEITFDSTGSWNNVGGYITQTSPTDFTVVQTGLYQMEFNALILAGSGTWTTTTNKAVRIEITRSPTSQLAIITNAALMASGVDYGQCVNATYYLVAGDIINLVVANTYSFISGTLPQAQGVTNTFDLNTFFTWSFISA